MFKKLLSLSLLLLVAIGCTIMQHSFVHSQTLPEISPEIEQINFKQHFKQLKINGSILICDRDCDRTYQHNRRRNQTAFIPASTYKIPNSLIALETGVIKDDVAVLTWDGIERGVDGSPLAQWNQDLNMRLAFKHSAVWFYQVLARKIGYQRMQEFVDKMDYGDRNLGKKEDIDKFWLEGELRITPQQQITFLRRLYQNDLPFSPETMNLVKDIAITEQTSNYTLRGKTGWADNVGWYVGYLEQNDNVYFFATNLEVNSQTDPALRLEVTRLCLQDLGLF